MPTASKRNVLVGLGFCMVTKYEISLCIFAYTEEEMIVADSQACLKI